MLNSARRLLAHAGSVPAWLQRLLFAIADRLQPRAVDALLHQEPLGLRRAPLAEREVVLVRAALVGVTRDAEGHVRRRAHDLGLGGQRGAGLGREVGAVEGEVNPLGQGGATGVGRGPDRVHADRRGRRRGSGSASHFGCRRRSVLDLLATAGGDEAKSQHGNEESGCASHRFLPVVGGTGMGMEAATPPFPSAAWADPAPRASALGLMA